MSGDTAARSLAHWSEAGRREMQAFYRLATVDYEQLAGVMDWRAVLAGRPSLLDVACGSGRFPTALVDHAGVGDLDPVAYDLLDPSAFSLAEAASVLRPPFTARERFESTLEDLDSAAGPWDVVWATHALYALEPAHLAAAMDRFRAAIAPGGLGFIGQGARDSFYLQVYAAFLEGVRGGAGTPYLASEDLVAELTAQGAEPKVSRIAYDHVVAARDTAVLEGYLQRCLFDDSLALDEMLSAPVLGPLLASCLDADVYRFPQEVDCVVLGSARA